MHFDFNLQRVCAILHRPGLARFLDPVLRDDLLDQLPTGTDWFAPSTIVTDCSDTSDNKYLELALASSAVAIISGDGDLLVLDPRRGIRFSGRRPISI
jgi:putative PIN family toxin of toxin-antitoxin system